MLTKEAISNLAFVQKPVGTSFFGTNFARTPFFQDLRSYLSLDVFDVGMA
jgi:hypothetical protein